MHCPTIPRCSSGRKCRRPHISKLQGIRGRNGCVCPESQESVDQRSFCQVFSFTNPGRDLGGSQLRLCSKYSCWKYAFLMNYLKWTVLQSWRSVQGDSAKVGSPKARCLWRQECLEWFRGLPTLAYFDASVRDCHLQPLTEFDGNEHHRRLLQDSRADPSVITMIIPASDAIHTSSSKLAIRPAIQGLCRRSSNFAAFH